MKRLFYYFVIVTFASILYLGCSEDEKDTGGTSSYTISGKFLTLPRGTNLKIFAFMERNEKIFKLGEAQIKSDSSFVLTLATPNDSALGTFAEDNLGGNCLVSGLISPLNARGNSVNFGIKRNDTLLMGYVFITEKLQQEAEPNFLIMYAYVDRNFSANAVEVCRDTVYPGYIDIDSTYYQINALAGYNRLAMMQLRERNDGNTVLLTSNIPNKPLYFYYFGIEFGQDKALRNKKFAIFRMEQFDKISKYKMNAQ